MAFDVSQLAAYTKDNQDSLISKSLFDAKTQQLIVSGGNVMTEVKSAEQINVLDTDAVFQAGGTCGFNSSGTTVFTRRAVTIGKIKVHESLCPKTLEAKYLQLKMKAGSIPEEIPFEQVYSELKAGKIAEQLETALWQGDTTSGTANLARFDGLLKLLDASGVVVAANAKLTSGTITVGTGAATVVGVSTLFTSEVAVGDKLYNLAGTLIGTVLTITDDTHITLAANGAVAVTAAGYQDVPVSALNFAAPIAVATGISKTNIRTIIDTVWRQIPARVKGKKDVAVFVGWDLFETYISKLIDDNNYVYTAGNQAQSDGEILIPGTNYKIIALHGLDSTNRIFAMRTSNLYMGCDILGEEDNFEIFYAKEAMEVRFVAEFKLGINVAFPNEVVSFKLV
jgi:hypothetical protein